MEDIGKEVEGTEREGGRQEERGGIMEERKDGGKGRWKGPLVSFLFAIENRRWCSNRHTHTHTSTYPNRDVMSL